MRKICYITIAILLMIFLLPNGNCASNIYLNPGEYIEKDISVTSGDVIRGTYKTYDSPFNIRVGYCYIGCNYFSPPYPSGGFEILITSGSGIVEIYLMNIDIHGGYLEYSIRKQGDDGDPTYLMLIIIGVVIVGVVFTSIGIGIHFYSKHKKRVIINDNDFLEP